MAEPPLWRSSPARRARQELYRRAAAGDDAAAMREGQEQKLGAGQYGGPSPDREYGLRRPDFVREMLQSRERISGRDALRTMQEAFPAPAPAITLRKVAGARHLWVAEADIATAATASRRSSLSN